MSDFLVDDFLRGGEAAPPNLRHELFRLRTLERRWADEQVHLARTIARLSGENDHLKRQVQSLQDHSNVQLMEIRRLKDELSDAYRAQKALQDVAAKQSRQLQQHALEYGNLQPEGMGNRRGQWGA
jgi:regulator of replication initiation timing